MFAKRLLSVMLAVSAATPVFASTATADEVEFNPAGLQHKAGVYKCDMNRSVTVRSVEADLRTAVVHWNRHDYTMRAVNTQSGALRYEDAGSGLVWIVITSKSMLLDARHGKQLANDCKA